MGTERRRTTLVGEDANPKKLVGVGVLETFFGGFVVKIDGNVGETGGNVVLVPNRRMLNLDPQKIAKNLLDPPLFSPNPRGRWYFGENEPKKSD